MENKYSLKDFMNRIEKDFEVEAMVGGKKDTTENSVCAAIFINKDCLGFGYQVENSDNYIVKQVELDKISKVSFSGPVFTIQVKDETYDFDIVTDENALREMCKEFKNKKTVLEVKACGNLMNSNVGQTRKPMEMSYTSLERVTPFGVIKENVPVKPTEVENIPLKELLKEDFGQTRLFTVQEMDEAYEKEQAEMHKETHSNMDNTIVNPIIHEEVKSKNELFAQILSIDASTNVESPKESELEDADFVKEDTSKIKIITDELEQESRKSKDVMPEKPKPLTKKELKALEKQRRAEEKKELDLYKPAHPVRNLILGVICGMLIYVLLSYALAQSNIVELPLHDLVEKLLDLSSVLITNVKQ